MLNEQRRIHIQFYDLFDTNDALIKRKESLLEQMSMRRQEIGALQK